MVAIKEIIKVRQFLSFFVTLLSIMKKMFAISLSLLLFLSSTGLTYAQHFCGGRVVNEAIMIGEKFWDVMKKSQQRAIPVIWKKCPIAVKIFTCRLIPMINIHRLHSIWI